VVRGERRAGDGDCGGRCPRDKIGCLGRTFEVQLLAGKPSIGQLARAAVDTTSEIKKASDRSRLATQADESRTSVDAFVEAARGDVAAGYRVL